MGWASALIPRMISETTRDIDIGVFGAVGVYALVAPVDSRILGSSLNFNLGAENRICL